MKATVAAGVKIDDLEGQGVYLIHFDTPYRHARHYMGFAGCIRSRLDQHHDGGGARLMQVIREHGITWQVVRIWPGYGRKDERKLKLRKEAPRLCPVCKQAVK